MNEPISEDDDIIGLWRSGPQPDTRGVLRALASQNRARRVQAGVLFALLAMTTLLLALAELTKRTGTQGLLSLFWLAALGSGTLLHRQVHRRSADALALGTHDLLRVMILHARRGLRLARFLYAGTPAGAAVGWLISAGGRWGSVHPRPFFDDLQAMTGSALLTLMIASGLVFARQRGKELRSLIATQDALGTSM